MVLSKYFSKATKKFAFPPERISMDPAIISALAASAVSALKLVFTKGSEEEARAEKRGYVDFG